MVGKKIILLFIFTIASSLAEAQCTSPNGVAGTREYFTSNHTMRLCDGTNWKPFFTAGTLGTCSNAGRIDWDASITAYKYCSNTVWQQAKLPSCTIGTGSLSYASKVTHSTFLDQVSGMDISTDGTKLYALGQYTNNFRIYDISGSPAAPTLLGTLANANLNENYAIKVYGNYAFIPSRSNDRLSIVNVSNPASPTYVTHVQSSPASQMNNIWGIDISADGQYAYTTSWQSGPSSNACFFHVINISNPASPSIAGTLNLTPGTGAQYCNDPVANGNYVYVAFGDDAFAAVNVSNPASPTLASFIDNPHTSGSYGVVLSSDKTKAYTISNSANKISVWNISNPNSISYITNIVNATNFAGGPHLSAAGDYIFATGQNNDYVTALNVSTGTPAIAASITSSTNLDGPVKTKASGRYLYVSAYYGDSISIIDMGCTPVPNYGTCALTAAVQYFPYEQALAYCDGSHWRPMAR